MKEEPKDDWEEHLKKYHEGHTIVGEMQLMCRPMYSSHTVTYIWSDGTTTSITTKVHPPLIFPMNLG